MATKKQNNIFYNGNKLLKAFGVNLNYTQDQLTEYIKCSQDPIYFIKTYVKIVHVDKGTVPFELYGFQEDIINAYHNNRKVICKIGRQQGKTTTTAAYFLWFVLFNKDKLVAIMANKAAVAREILSRIQYAYECLPFWLQQGVKEWNKGSIELENGSGIITAATSPNAIRGFAAAAIYIDETAFIPPNIAEEFFTSVFPTISSGNNTKLFLSSTPKGLNIFHRMWTEAISGTNGFVPVEAHWYDNPTRDEKWLKDQKDTLGELKFNQEVLCHFLGSSKTLISGEKLGQLAAVPPISTKDNLSIYTQPQKDHAYVISVDTSRGQHLDFSAFVVIDITTLPYKVVATFKDNQISTMAYPFLIWNVAKQYNDAYCLIEINDAGGEIANTLFYEYEYENVYFTHKDEISEGGGYPGVRTTKRVKQIGCSVLKDLVEKDQLELNSNDILQELSRFSQKGASYAAEDTNINDDLCACLFLFAYLTKQDLFMDLTDVNIRKILAQKTEEYISEQIMPVGFHTNGFEDSHDHSTELDLSVYGGSVIDPLDRWMLG